MIFTQTISQDFSCSSIEMCILMTPTTLPASISNSVADKSSLPNNVMRSLEVRSTETVVPSIVTLRGLKKPINFLTYSQQSIFWGSVCGSVGRAVTFDTRGPQFVRKKCIEQLFTVNCIEKTKIKKKRPGMAHSKTSRILKFWRSICVARLYYLWKVLATNLLTKVAQC